MLLTLVDKQKHEWNTILILVKANFYDYIVRQTLCWQKKKRSHTWWREENKVEQHKQTNWNVCDGLDDVWIVFCIWGNERERADRDDYLLPTL